MTITEKGTCSRSTNEKEKQVTVGEVKVKINDNGKSVMVAAKEKEETVVSQPTVKHRVILHVEEWDIKRLSAIVFFVKFIKLGRLESASSREDGFRKYGLLRMICILVRVRRMYQRKLCAIMLFLMTWMIRWKKKRKLH